jgi:nucleoside phosphorylase
MLAILAALNEEVSGLKSSLSITKYSLVEDCRLYEGQYHQRHCLLVLTGVGKKRAQKAVKAALERYPVKTMVSTGFSGALSGNTRVGDIVVYSGLGFKDDAKGNKRLESTLTPDSDLMSLSIKLLNETGLPFISGRGLTLETVCSSPEAKKALGQEFEAESVDMESYWLAITARENRIPFITVRAIFDELKDDLTCLTRISTDGKIDQGAAAWQALKHPWQIKEMAHYARCARKAEKNLTVFLSRLVASWEQK